MYLSTSRGKIRFGYYNRKGKWYDFKGDARFKADYFLEKGWKRKKEQVIINE